MAFKERGGESTPGPEQVRKTVDGIADRYGRDPERLMDVALAAQAELGCISDQAIRAMADALGLRQIQVLDTVSFYSFFRRSPGGRCVVRLSDCVVGRMQGMDEVSRALQERQGVSPGGTTADGAVSLETTSCIGMCDQGPAAMVDGRVVTALKARDVPALVEFLRADPDAALARIGLPGAGVRDSVIKAGPVVFAPFRDGAALERALEMGPEEVIEEAGGGCPVFLVSSAGDAVRYNLDPGELGLAGIFQKPIDNTVLIRTLKRELKVP